MLKAAMIAVITSMVGGDGKVTPGCLACALNTIAVCTTASFTSTSQIEEKHSNAYLQKLWHQILIHLITSRAATKSYYLVLIIILGHRL